MSNKKNITTIKLQKQTKLRLDKLRENKGETYDDILIKMLWLLSLVKVEPEKAKYTLQKIDDLQGKLKKQKQEKK